MLDNEHEDEEISTAPDTVQDFIERFDPPEKFRIILKRTAGPGAVGIIRQYNADEVEESEFDTVGANYGPGKYQWNLSWRDKETGKSKMRSFTRELAPDEYEEIYLQKQVHKENRRVSRVQTPAVTPEAITAAVEKQLNSTMALVKQFSPPVVPVQNNDNIMVAMMQMQQQSQANMMSMIAESNKTTMTMIAAMMQGMTGIVSGVLNRPTPDQGADPMGMFTNAINTVRQMVDIKQAMQPAEKETMVEQIVNLVSTNLPLILSVVEMKAAERKNSIIYNTIQNSAQMKQLESDPKMKAETVQKVAEQIGLENTKKVCDALGWHEFDSEIDAAIQSQKNTPVYSESEEE